MNTNHPSSCPDVVTALNQSLAESYGLLALTQYAHWNVEGEGFFALHTAFQTQYEELFIAIDELAERVRALGAYAVGGLTAFQAMARVPEIKAPASQKDFVAVVVKGQDVVLESLRRLRNAAEAAGDTETEDMAIARIRVHEKTRWMLESYLK